jgi:hypothetical protein
MSKVFEKIFGFLSGNKTYLLSIAGAVLAILKSQGVEVPEWVFVLGGSLGLGTLRNAVGK